MDESVVAGPLPRAWSVAALVLAVGDLIAARLGAVTVQGEISGFTRAASGHCYFSLRDGGGANVLLRCVMFRRAAQPLDFQPADGQRVELRGRIGVYEPRGELQLVAEGLQRLGQGSLYEEFLRLRARLETLGLFDPARKRQIARHPGCMGVVTSLGAAALQDVLSALARRSPQVAVEVYPCLVQGAEAPAAIVAALAQAVQRGRADTLLLVRGGGSLEDLWAFNDERVVRAIAASAIPVVCGVGHETDVTLADLAADLRAPTPTAAAELAASAQSELLDGLAAQALRLARASRRVLERESQRLDLAGQRLSLPRERVAVQRQRLDALARRWPLALQGSLARRHERLAALAARLSAAHPRQVLQRGFAWLQDEGGHPLTRIAAMQPASLVHAVLADGRAALRVERLQPDTPT